MAETAAMRETAKGLFRVAVAAADPDQAVRRFASAHGLKAAQAGRTLLLAFGKAAPAMARAALDNLPPETEALVITHHENAQDVQGATVMTAGHPVPDAAGAAAARALIARMPPLTDNDRVIALVSGGASALLPAPPKGISLNDKQALNSALLASGLDIVQMNLVRQQVSDLKGGGLLRLAAPAPVQALILSDVIGDDLRAIASGPTVAPLGTRRAAKDVLQAAAVWEGLPAPIKLHLPQNTQIPDTPSAENHLIGSNRVSLEAMRTASQAVIVSDALVGDVEDAALQVAKAAGDLLITQATGTNVADVQVLILG